MTTPMQFDKEFKAGCDEVRDMLLKKHPHISIKKMDELVATLATELYLMEMEGQRVSGTGMPEPKGFMSWKG